VTGFLKIFSKRDRSQWSNTISIPSPSALARTCHRKYASKTCRTFRDTERGLLPISLPHLNMTFPLDILIHVLLCMKIHYVTKSQNKGSRARRAVRPYQRCCQHHQPLSLKFSATRIMYSYQQYLNYKGRSRARTRKFFVLHICIITITFRKKLITFRAMVRT
jgi:hypothetical protein